MTTPNQRRVLESAGIEVREGGPSLFGIPVQLIDGPNADTVYIMDARKGAAVATLPDSNRPIDPFAKRASTRVSAAPFRLIIP